MDSFHQAGESLSLVCWQGLSPGVCLLPCVCFCNCACFQVYVWVTSIRAFSCVCDKHQSNLSPRPLASALGWYGLLQFGQKTIDHLQPSLSWLLPLPSAGKVLKVKKWSPRKLQTLEKGGDMLVCICLASWLGTFHLFLLRFLSSLWSDVTTISCHSDWEEPLPGGPCVRYSLVHQDARYPKWSCSPWRSLTTSIHKIRKSSCQSSSQFENTKPPPVCLPTPQLNSLMQLSSPRGLIKWHSCVKHKRRQIQLLNW